MATDIHMKEGLNSITESLVATYTECSLDQSSRPRAAAEQGCRHATLLATCLKSSIPASAVGRTFISATSNITLESLVDSLHDKLTQQVARALRHDTLQRIAPYRL